MRIMKRFVLIAVLTAPIGLYAQSPDTPQKNEPHKAESEASVYFYRYKQFVGSALSPSVYCDDVQLARLDNGRYFVAHIAPGKHSFRSNDSQSGVELDVKGNEKYFIRVEIATGMMKGHGRLILASPEQGSYEMNAKQLKPLDAGKISDKNRVSSQRLAPEAFEGQH